MRTAKLILHGMVAIATVFYTFATALLAVPITVNAQTVGVPATIGYNGRLFNASGTALTGTYYFWVDLESALTAGTNMGSNIQGFADADGDGVVDAGETAITVTNGYFTMEVPIGSDVADFGNNIWLELKVHTADVVGSAETLSPRVRVTKTPYSIFTQAIENSSADPSVTFGGRAYYDTDEGKLKIYDAIAAAWVTMEGYTNSATMTVDNANATAINIGAGAVAKTITLGNSTGATSVVLNSGTGPINIGTNAIAHTITLGNSTGATSVVLDSGTGAINIGTNAVAHTVTMGTTTGAGATVIQSGTGDVAITSSDDFSVTITDAITIDGAEFDVSGTTGGVTINDGGDAGALTVEGTNLDINSLDFVGAGTITSAAGTALAVTSGSTGALTLDSGSTGSVNLGTGSTAKIVTIGNATGATAVNILTGTGDMLLDADAAAGSDITLDAYDATNNTTGAVVAHAGYIQLNTFNSTGPGSAGVDVNVGGSGALAMDTSDGAISIAGGGSNGSVALTSGQNDITIDTQTASRSINIGSSSVARTINIGTPTGADTVNFGTQSSGSLDTFNFFSSETTNDTMDIFFDSITSANGIDYTIDGLTTGRGFYMTHTGIMSGALWSTETTDAWTGEIWNYDDIGNASWTGNILDIDTGTGNASGNILDINIEDSTNDDVQAIVVANASQSDQAGWLMDIDTSAAWTSNALDFTTGAQAWTGNMFDVNIGAAASTGDVFNVSMGSSNLSGGAFVVADAGGVRTDAIIDITSASIASTEAGSIMQLNGTGALAGAHVLDINVSGGSTSGNVIDVTTSGTFTASNLIDLNAVLADTGDAINITAADAAVAFQALVIDTAGGIQTASPVYLDWDNTTGIVALIDIDSAGTRGGVMDVDVDGALATEHLIDVTYNAASTSNAIDLNMGGNVTGDGLNMATAATTGNAIDITSSGIFSNELIDVNVGAQAATGDVMNIALGATAVAAQALVVDSAGASSTNGWVLSGDNSGNALWTGDMLNLRSGTADVSGDFLNMTMEAGATDLQALVVANAAISDQAGWLMDIDTSAAWTSNALDFTTGAQAWTGNVLDVNFGNAAATGDVININNPALAVATQAIVLDNAAASTTDGWLIDANASAAFTNTAIDIDTTAASSGDIVSITTATAATSGNLIDLNFGNIADTGDAVNVSMGAAAVGAQAFVATTSAGIRTASAIQITENNTTGSVATIDWDSAQTRGGFMDIDLTGALGTEHLIDIDTTAAGSSNLIDLTFATAAWTGNALDLNMGTNVAGDGMNIASASATGQAIQIDSITSLSTAGIIDLNITAGNTDVDGINLSLAQNDGATAGVDAVGLELSLTGNDADGDMFGIVITGAATANATSGTYEAAIFINNAENTVGSMPDAILIASSGINMGVTDAIDASAANIDNALNVGANDIEGTTATITFTDFSVNDDGLTTLSPDGAGDAITVIAAAADIQALVVDAATANNRSTAGLIQIIADMEADNAGTIGIALDYEILEEALGGNNANSHSVIDVTATMTSNDGDHLTGVFIRDLVGTPAAGNEIAFNIGSGWDAQMRFMDTTTFIDLANGGSMTWEDTAGADGNDLMILTDNGTDGNLSVTGDVSVGDDFTVEGIIDFGTSESMADNDLTPSVLSGSFFTSNAAADIITRFDDAVAGQIWIVLAAVTTTYDCDNTDGGADDLDCGTADIVTASGDVTTWFYDGTQSIMLSWMDDSVAQAGGADLAEWFAAMDDVQPGDVLVAGSDPVTVAKSSSAYQKGLIGIVTTQPGIVLGDRGASTFAAQVALAGRVPVNISDENGAIHIGDYLTSSATLPGYAMKATEAGPVIAIAMENFSGGTGQITVKVENFWYAPVSELQGGSSALLSLSGDISVGTGAFSGSVLVAGHLYGSQDMAGRIRMASGETSVRVTFQTAYDFTPIVTFSARSNSLDAREAWVSNEDESGFTLNRPESTSDSQVEFNWIAIGVEDAQVTVSDLQGGFVQISINDENGPSAPAPVVAEDVPVVEEVP